MHTHMAATRMMWTYVNTFARIEFDHGVSKMRNYNNLSTNMGIAFDKDLQEITAHYKSTHRGISWYIHISNDLIIFQFSWLAQDWSSQIPIAIPELVDGWRVN
jgi:hypothetical protein